jgi:hypothetical protein
VGTVLAVVVREAAVMVVVEAKVVIVPAAVNTPAASFAPGLFTVE